MESTKRDSDQIGHNLTDIKVNSFSHRRGVGFCAKTVVAVSIDLLVCAESKTFRVLYFITSIGGRRYHSF